MLLVQYYFSCPLFSLSSSLSLVYTRPKVQAHHLLIRQKECNEIINVLELIMNMIKKAKISGAGLSLPIHSYGLLSFRQGEAKKPPSRVHSGSVLHPVCLSPCLCGRRQLTIRSNRAGVSTPRWLSCTRLVVMMQRSTVSHLMTYYVCLEKREDVLKLPVLHLLLSSGVLTLLKLNN